MTVDRWWIQFGSCELAHVFERKEASSPIRVRTLCGVRVFRGERRTVAVRCERCQAIVQQDGAQVAVAPPSMDGEDIRREIEARRWHRRKPRGV